MSMTRIGYGVLAASAIGGYWVKDIGITFKVETPPIQREVRK